MSSTKVPFAFHFLHDKQEGKVLFIVTLPHLSDISKIEVWVKDQYKLKVNTKKATRGDACLEIHLLCLPSFIHDALFVRGVST